MSRQVSRGPAGDYQADEQAGLAWLSWQLSRRCAGRCCGAQLASNKQMSRQVSRGSAGEYQAEEKAGVARSAGEYQADEQAGVAGLSWRVSGRREGRYRAAQLAIIRQMSRQVSRGSAGEYQADEQAGVPRLSWRVSGR